MDINCVGVMIFCVIGFMYFNNALGETDNLMSIFKDIRNELNNLKASNERNERKILRLEKQVIECRTKDDQLSRHIASFAHIEKQLTDIEHNVEERHHDILKRLESIELTNAIKQGTHEHDGQTSEGEERANVVSLKKALHADGAAYYDKQGADIDGVVDENGQENINEMKEKSSIDKRIVPVTSRPTVNTRIAFSAYLTNDVISLSKGRTVPFNNLSLNVGQAFNIFSHIFTCPVSGIYYFASSVMAEKHHKALTKIVKEHTLLADVYSASESGTWFDQGSNSVVTECNSGESVWVKSSDGCSVVGDMFTTFSGFLVSEL